jgi:hypothetical protein
VFHNAPIVKLAGWLCHGPMAVVTHESLDIPLSRYYVEPFPSPQDIDRFLTPIATPHGADVFEWIPEAVGVATLLPYLILNAPYQ